MEQQKIKMFTDAESEIYFCAFRYCLGRMSYVVSDFCEEATRKIKQINDHFLLLLEKELIEAIQKDDAKRANGEIHKTLGWDCDRKEWVEFTKTVSAEIERRKLQHYVIRNCKMATKL